MRVVRWGTPGKAFAWMPGKSTTVDKDNSNWRTLCAYVLHFSTCCRLFVEGIYTGIIRQTLLIHAFVFFTSVRFGGPPSSKVSIPHSVPRVFLRDISRMRDSRRKPTKVIIKEGIQTVTYIFVLPRLHRSPRRCHLSARAIFHAIVKAL